jgi:DNA repair photolyase
MGGNTPTLKKCFENEDHALEVFMKEMHDNLPELKKHGLFFTFTSDPCLKETIMLTIRAIRIALHESVPCKILTKCADWANGEPYKYRDYSSDNMVIMFPYFVKERYKPLIAFGFTLTGHDELEPNASPNAERVEAMRKLHEAGFKTWASIEPIIDFDSSLEMIKSTMEFCDLYKIGLESSKKYDKHNINVFIQRCFKYAHLRSLKIYFKDGLLKQAGISRSELPDNCVSRDYDMFNR